MLGIITRILVHDIAASLAVDLIGSVGTNISPLFSVHFPLFCFILLSVFINNTGFSESDHTPEIISVVGDGLKHILIQPVQIFYSLVLATDHKLLYRRHHHILKQVTLSTSYWKSFSL